MPALNYSLKPIADGLAGEQKAQSRKTGGATVNSEGFRETFLRNGRKTQGAKTVGKKDAKQKASPCDRTEKI